MNYNEHRLKEDEDSSVFFTLPDSFHALDYLPESLRRRAYAADWFVSTIMKKLCSKSQCDHVRLLSRYLERMMGHGYAKIAAALIEGEVVVRSGNYAVGKRAFGFGLHPRFETSRHVRRPVNNKPLRDKIIQLRKEKSDIERKQWQSVHFDLRDRQRVLEIDGETARRMLLSMCHANAFDRLGILIRNIEDQQFRFSVGKFRRVFNSITNLKRELRSTLHVDGARLFGVDLKCAQPALIGLLIWAICGKCIATKTVNIEYCCGKSPNLSSSSLLHSAHSCLRSSTLQTFLGSIADGSLYELLSDSLKGRLDRDLLKVGLLKNVFANESGYSCEIADAFESLFPDVYSFIRAFHRNSQHKLIAVLQRLESWIVIENICPRVLRAHDLPVVSLHDAIYTTAEGTPLVEEAFDEVFSQLRYPMKWTVER